MNKRSVAFLTATVACCVALIGGTLAYFTDTDGKKNTMTMGNVDIVQNEQNADGSEFKQDQHLAPGVYEGTPVSGGLSNPSQEDIDAGNIGNMITKKISVTNEGSMDVYARTIVAFEHTLGASGDGSDGIAWKLHTVYNNEIGYEAFPGKAIDCVQIGDQYYSIVVFTYPKAIKAGTTSPVSLMSVFLDSSTTQEDVEGVGDTYEILALSQAVQVDGFNDAQTALDTAFGDVSEMDAADVAAWFTAAGLANVIA